MSDDAFSSGAYLVYIDSFCITDLRVSDLNTLGASEWWVPGLCTSGGQYEAVIGRIEGIKQNIYVTSKEVIK